MTHFDTEMVHMGRDNDYDNEYENDKDKDKEATGNGICGTFPKETAQNES